MSARNRTNWNLKNISFKKKNNNNYVLQITIKLTSKVQFAFSFHISISQSTMQIKIRIKTNHKKNNNDKQKNNSTIVYFEIFKLYHKSNSNHDFTIKPHSISFKIPSQTTFNQLTLKIITQSTQKPHPNSPLDIPITL